MVKCAAQCPLGIKDTGFQETDSRPCQDLTSHRSYRNEGMLCESSMQSLTLTSPAQINICPVRLVDLAKSAANLALSQYVDEAPRM